MGKSKDHNPYGVEIGQVWIDCDRRARGRRLVVRGIGDGFAVMQNLENGRSSRVQLTRFRERSCGYRLEVPPTRETDLLEPYVDRREW
jgi:hypothetical protein